MSRRIVHVPPFEFDPSDDTETFIILDDEVQVAYPFRTYGIAVESIRRAGEAPLEAVGIGGLGDDYRRHNHRPTYGGEAA